MDVIDALWAQVEPISYITREQFVRDLEHWEIEAVHVDGQLAFAALTRGPEFHFAAFDTGAQITRTMIRERLDPIIATHGFVTTKTPKEGADRQHRFNRAFGFQAAGECEFFIHYRMDQKCR
jgi:hypothetical protein